jgi:hypothetical protein
LRRVSAGQSVEFGRREWHRFVLSWVTEQMLVVIVVRVTCLNPQRISKVCNC